MSQYSHCNRIADPTAWSQDRLPTPSRSARSLITSTHLYNRFGGLYRGPSKFWVAAEDIHD
jgi:hypothetical protein